MIEARFSRTLMRAGLLGVLLGVIAATTAQGVALPGPVIVNNFTCTPNMGCANYYVDNSTDCPNIKCVGSATTGRIKACSASTSQCTKDESTQGSLTCPGVCQDKANTACSFKVTGCSK